MIDTVKIQGHDVLKREGRGEDVTFLAQKGGGGAKMFGSYLLSTKLK